MVAPKKLATGAIVVSAATALTLSACSGASTETKTTSVTKSAAAAVNDAGISPKDLATPPALKAGFEGAIKDWKMDGQCDTKIGDQKVTGTIKSSAKEAKDYVVVVNWVHGSDVMGRAVKLVEKVEPGKEVKVELATKLTKAADGCTVNVTRGAKG